MSLPKNTTPRFKLKLPSSGEEIFFRPFLVKEEKLLLMANEGGDQDEIIDCMHQILSECVEADIAKLPFFDIEYLFLNLRAKSVGEEIKLVYAHREGKNNKGEICDAKTHISIPLEEIQIENAGKQETKFMIDEKYGVQMRYPGILDIRNLAAKRITELEFMASCIVYVYDQNEVFHPDGIQDALEFVNNMTAKQYERFSRFFNEMPKLKHTLHYNCSGCGQQDTVTFEGVADFF